MAQTDPQHPQPKKCIWCVLCSHAVFIPILIAIAFVVRLHSISTPLADWHSWRQADTASVTREYVKHNYPLLLPHFQDLSDIPNGLNNVDGYRMVEFPIVNYGVAQLLKTFPSLDLVQTSRMVSIGFSLVSVVALYSIVWQLSKRKILAVLSSLVFALLPYSIYYSRVILPEPAQIAGQLLALAAFIPWLASCKAKKPFAQRVPWLLLSIAAYAFSLLLKPTSIFIAPLFVVLTFSFLGWSAFRTFELYLLPIFSLLPVLWWRKYILSYPSGIPASNWLLNGNGIRLHPAWWRWLFADRLGRLILGYWGVIFVFLGGIAQGIPGIGKRKLQVWDAFTLAWVGCMFAYLVIFATGNVQHDYYQSMLVPIISLLFARGVVFLLDLRTTVQNPAPLFLGTVFVLGLCAYFSWNEVSGYFNINHPEIVAAGQAADKLLPADAKVIAPYDGDTAFLFQTNRTGWPIGGRIDEKIKLGAQYYVTTTENDEAKQLEKSYPILAKTSQYLILKLK